MNAITPRPTLRHGPEALSGLAARLFEAAGLDADKARCVSRLLVLTDMMGRTTHGLAQVPPYLEQLASGDMTASGAPETIRDTGATLVWDGRYLPGLWLMDRALDAAMARVAEHGVVTFSMRRSHHIGCLAALAKQAADRGYFVTIASSGPHTKFVAPFGGKEGLFSPNPFAFGFPTSAFPVLIDTCASLTTVSMTREKAAAGAQFDQPYLLDNAGRPTRDPTVMEGGGKGTLMLRGGVEAGHMGFGLALRVDALTLGVSGCGRRAAPTRWGASVYMQLIDIAAFAGRDAFLAQMDFLAARCHANAPIDPARPVRLPGEQAARNIAQAEAGGIAVPDRTARALRDWAARLGVDAALLN